MNSTSWLQYFESNRLKRTEPQWHLPLPETGAIAAKLARSLSHFALGESISSREIFGALVIGSALLLIDGRVLKFTRDWISTPNTTR